MTPPAEGHVIAGKYRLERPLSRGGMGSVWAARHVELGMPVAVKRMDPLMAARPEWRQRFAREARAAGAIQSPHVVKVLDYGVDEGAPYLVMELLSGEDLGARLRREGRLSLEAAARLVVAIAKGLRRAHEAGVVHRDLKPANVFLARVDDDEIVQILDFGIAKLTRSGADEGRTETGVVLGSIHYMSPEQARGFRDADHRADVWSLGVIAYRALTGELPFPGDETGDVLVKVCTDPVPAASTRLRTLDPRTGRALDIFFARALAKSPADRFQTARELGDALCAVAGLPVEAPATAPVIPSFTNTDSEDTSPTRTDAIPALAADPTPVPLRGDPAPGAGAEPASGEVSASVDEPPPRGQAAPRRAAWAIGGVVGVAALATVLFGLAQREGPFSPARSATGAPSPAGTPLPAVTTAGPDPAAPGAVPLASGPAATLRKTTATAASSPLPAPAAPSGTATVPAASSSTSPTAVRPAVPPAPRPAVRPGDRVKEKFGF